MATIREGNRPVMMVVDVQVGVMNSVWDAERVIKNVGVAVDRARSQGVPVIWVQHADEEMAYGSPAWQLPPELAPAAEDARIFKKYNSSFEETNLEQTLAALGATRIVLAGAATNWCIRATAYGALDRGYDLTLVSDAHTTGEIELEGGVTITAEDIIRELNVGMTWVSYPGRTNSTAAAAEVDFAAP